MEEGKCKMCGHEFKAETTEELKHKMMHHKEEHHKKM